MAGGYQQNLRNPLPARLAIAAERVCREVHGDGDDQVARMLDGLAHCPADDWGSLADHFESQLPPPPEPGRERITLQADAYQFDMDVPTEHVAAFVARASDAILGAGQPGTGLTPADDATPPPVRFSLRFQLHNGQAGSVLGSPGTTEEELRETLRAKYGSRLASVDDKPLPGTP